jgi:hypothetical protein
MSIKIRWTSSSRQGARRKRWDGWTLTTFLQLRSYTANASTSLETHSGFLTPAPVGTQAESTADSSCSTATSLADRRRPQAFGFGRPRSATRASTRKATRRSDLPNGHPRCNTHHSRRSSWPSAGNSAIRNITSRIMLQLSAASPRLFRSDPYRTEQCMLRRLFRPATSLSPPRPIRTSSGIPKRTAN